MIRSYRDLEVWKRSMELVVACYQAVETLPSSEKFGLVSQIRRAATSISANIAEGHGRNYTREYIQHLGIAYGSLMELETHVQVSRRLGMLESSVSNDLLSRTDTIGKMLSGLKNSLRNRRPRAKR